MSIRGLLACTSLFVLASIGCSASTDEESGVSNDELRRYEDADSEAPEVGILRTETGYCTATLIGPRTILTAAHCFGFSSTLVADAQPPFASFTIKDAAGRRIRYGIHRARADANVINVKFDLAVAELDVAVSPSTATPATIAHEWPDGRLAVYGYGRFGDGCEERDAQQHKKRKTTVPSSFPWVKATTCPGDSGGPYFKLGSREIVATVKGDGLGLEWVGDAVQHRSWIEARRAESEAGHLAP